MDGETPNGMRPFREMPGPGQEFPWTAIGRQIELDRDPIRFMQKIRQRYGNLVRYESVCGREVFAFGPDNNRELHRNTDLFHSRPFVLKGPKYSSQTRLRYSIFQMNGPAYHEMRHQLLPPFQKTSVADYHTDVVRLIANATAPWQAGTERDIHRDMHLLVWNIVRQILYGMEENQASSELHERLEHWMLQTFSPWVRAFQLDLPFMPYGKMLREAEALEAHFLEIMQTRRDQGTPGRDALSSMLKIRGEDGKLLSTKAMVGHALTLFLVAYETTGNTLAWTLFLLAQHPRVLQALLDELAPLRGDFPEANQLDKLPLLDHVVKETMRLLPAVPYNRRQVSKNGTLGEFQVPQGTRVMFSHYITHHLPEIYPEPERFLPERWDTISPSPAEYLPFGAGVRTCLGASLAPFIIKLTLAHILPRWKLSLIPHSTLDRQLGISLGPKGGLPMHVARQDRRLQAVPIHGNIHEMVDLRHCESNSPALARAA